jgi:hypothetical protein
MLFAKLSSLKLPEGECNYLFSMKGCFNLLFSLGQVPTLGPLAQSAVIYYFPLDKSRLWALWHRVRWFVIFPWTSPLRVFNLPDFGPFGTECGNLLIVCVEETFVYWLYL